MTYDIATLVFSGIAATAALLSAGFAFWAVRLQKKGQDRPSLIFEPRSWEDFEAPRHWRIQITVRNPANVGAEIKEIISRDRFVRLMSMEDARMPYNTKTGGVALCDPLPIEKFANRAVLNTEIGAPGDRSLLHEGSDGRKLLYIIANKEPNLACLKVVWCWRDQSKLRTTRLG